MQLDKHSFILYLSYHHSIKSLTLEQKGKLLDLIFEFHYNTEITSDDTTVNMAFSFIKQDLIKNHKKWKDTQQKRIEAGKKGGRPKKDDAFFASDNKAKKANAFSEKQMKAKKAVDVDVDVDVDNNKTPISPLQGEIDNFLLDFSENEKKAIEAWFIYRKEAKKPYKTKSSLTALRNKMLELKASGILIEAINHSIAMEYTGLFPPTHKRYDAKTKTTQQIIDNCGSQDYSTKGEF